MINNDHNSLHAESVLIMNRGLQDILLRHWLFGSLPGYVIANLSSQFSSRLYSPGSYVFHQNDQAEHLYVILDGEVSIENISTDGKLMSIAYLRAGDIFGEFALIDGLGRSASARIIRQAIIASLSEEVFSRLIKDHPEFSEKLLKVLVKRVRSTNQNMECLIMLSLSQRLARLLLQIMEQDTDIIQITQTNLGDRLHASREKVNLKLKELEKMGILECGRGKVTILDRERLAGLVQF